MMSPARELDSNRVSICGKRARAAARTCRPRASTSEIAGNGSLAARSDGTDNRDWQCQNLVLLHFQQPECSRSEAQYTPRRSTVVIHTTAVLRTLAVVCSS